MTQRKPVHLKLLSNTIRPCRDQPVTGPTRPVLSELPPAPDWLADDLESLKEWQRLGCVMASCGMLNEGNIGLLAALCSVHGSLIQARATGEPPRAALLAVFRGLSSDLGLTRMTLPVGPVRRVNRFANNAAR